MSPESAPIQAHIAVQSEAYLGQSCYRACLADARGPLYLMLAGKKYLPCAQWDGSTSWEAGVRLAGNEVELLRQCGRFAQPHEALGAGHDHALKQWGTLNDQRWYSRPDHWAHPQGFARLELRWPLLMQIEGEFEQAALVARLRRCQETLDQLEGRRICRLEITLRRSRSEEPLVLLKHRAIPLEQVRWELEDLTRSILTRQRNHNLYLWTELRDITAQPNVLNLLLSGL